MSDPRRISEMQSLSDAIDHVPQEQLAIFGEAAADLWRYNLTQPYLADSCQEGVKARARQWAAISGQRAALRSRLLRWGCVAAGAVAGFIFGIPISVGIGGNGADAELAAATSTVTSMARQQASYWVPAIVAVAGAAAGWWGARFVGQANGYYDGMMQVFINERLSPITPAMVTAQAEIWVPKVLMAHRSHEWRYQGGRPYMWLHLPFGERLLGAINSTLSVLALETDEYVAVNAAVYSRRTINRMISDSGVDFGEIDNPEEEGNPLLEAILPYAPPVVMVGIGLLVVMLAAG